MDIELSAAELTNDPLIALLMRADGVDQQQLSDLLGQTARQQVSHLQERLRQARAEDFYSRLDLAFAARTGKMSTSRF